MSPVPPPPAGTFVPSEDWSNDDSFDFDSGEISHSPSHASPHRPRLSGMRVTPSSSPLRQSHARANPNSNNNDDDDDDFDFDNADDGTDSFPALPIKPSMGGTIKRLTLNHDLQQTVVGSGPNGVGTITKFVPKKSPALAGALSKGSIRMKDAAVAKAWEDDLDLDDLDDEGDWKGRLASKSKSKSAGGADGGPPSLGTPGGMLLRPVDRTGEMEMPGADALDGFDDLEEEDREATLKASATLKAHLPPPRPKTTTPPTVNTDILDLGDDADFDLPLNLTNLNLASRSSSSSQSQRQNSTGAGAGGGQRGPRSSMAGSDWDSGGTRTDWWSENGTPSKRLSETSGTSISDGHGLNSVHASASAKGKSRADPHTPSHVRGTQVAIARDGAEEEEDMEEGLVIPSKLFFTTTSKRELDDLLDRKRKPQFASAVGHSPFEHGDMTIRAGGGGGRVEEGMEDGLVFEDQGRELTMNRLTLSKKARSRSRSHIPIPAGMKRLTATPSSTITSTVRAGGSTARHPSHDILGRAGLPSLRERTQSLVGHGHGYGLRSHSAGNVPTLAPAHSHSSTRPNDGDTQRAPAPGPGDGSPSKMSDHYRSRSSHLPGSASIPSTPSRGLRHQKSHHLLTSPSPSKPSAALSKKQSLSSLTSAGVLHTLVEDGESTPHKHPHPQAYAPASNSRLTMPTSSSKAKARPPISSVFPMAHAHTPSSSSSSPPAPSAPLSTRSKIRQAGAASGAVLAGGGMRVKRRDWGDGTELEGIEDLEVDVNEKDSKSSWSKARAKLLKEKKSQSVLSPDKRSKPGSGFRDNQGGSSKDGAGAGGSWGRKKKRPPLLIKHLGSVDQRKVVGEMTWNPVKLRWEGNETALRDFDNIPISTSARPALITHISNPTSPSTAHLPLDTGGSRIVGDMRFDPKEMRWISLSPDEEPDPFEGMADDEDDGDYAGGGGTIRARRLVAVGLSEASESLWSTSRKASEAVSVSAVSVLGSSAGESSSTTTTAGSSSTSGVEAFTGHGVDASLVSDELRAECASAEERHKKDMRGWISNGGSWSRTEARREEKRLWDIRHLALRS